MNRRITRKPVRFMSRGLLLFVLPLPLLPTLIIFLLRGSLTRAGATLGALLLYLGSGVLMRRGLSREQDFHARKVARAPRIPRKTLALLLLTMGTWLLATFTVGQPLLFSLFLTFLAGSGGYLAYGIDPRHDKGVEPGFDYTTEELVAAVQEAENKIKDIEEVASRLHKRELAARLERITTQAHKIVQQLEEDPARLRQARKFLNIYLDGARQVTRGYADTMSKTSDPALEEQFIKVLKTIEDVFARQYEALLARDLLNLDVQMEVLLKQMKNEGIL